MTRRNLQQCIQELDSAVVFANSGASHHHDPRLRSDPVSAHLPLSSEEQGWSRRGLER